MTRLRDTDQLIREFLQDGLTELPDRAYDAVRSQIDHTRQRVVIGPWKEEQVSRFAMFAIAAAAVVLIAVVGIRFLPPISGVGAQPTPTPTASPIPDKSGQLEPGTYVAHPFGPDSASFTFSVPSRSWEGMSFDGGGTKGVAWYGNTNGVGLGFLRVTSLERDPCKWSGTNNDIALGPSVDDLVNALTASTNFETSVPNDVTVSGYSGKHVVVTMPDTGFMGANALGCDGTNYFIWNADGFNIYAQGPSNRWDLRILDVGGERVVIMASSFVDSEPVRLTELKQIADSIAINR